jgi:Tol biopolymer transport system component
MSGADDLAARLAELEAPVEPRAAFADDLQARLLLALAADAPAAPLRSALAERGAARRRPRSRVRAAFIAVALLLVLASAATATYVVVRDAGGDSPSLINSPSNGVASLTMIDADGSKQTVWRCPHGEFCGDVTSVAWSPDGTRVAIALGEIGGHSVYPGLHVIDVGSGRDVKLVGLTPFLLAPAGSAQHARAQRSAFRKVIAAYGCLTPDQLAWSPDGTRIAYACALGLNARTVSDIHIMQADGTHPYRLRTGTHVAAWPSWSPDGSRIAFSTALTPLVKAKSTSPRWTRTTRAVIYSVDLAGAHRRRIAFGAAPAWSPDGSAIAYRSTCGGRIRLVAPDGHDLTPVSGSARCEGIGPAGWPAWSPDGRRLAIGTALDLYAIDADGSDLVHVGGVSAGFGLGSVRPVWQPPAKGTGS